MSIEQEIRNEIDNIKQLKIDVDDINNHLNILEGLCRDRRKEYYQKGFEDGKAVHEKGCDGCKYTNKELTCPCSECSNNFKNHWTAKQTDEIKVGDEVEHTVSGYTSKAIFLEKNEYDEDWYKCLFWTGCGVTILSYPKRQFKRTGRHFDIDKILEEMKE